MKPATNTRIVWLVVCAWWWAAAATVAQEAPTSRADQLVQQLGAARFEQREQAAAELVQLGAAAREAVRRGLQSPDAEVRHRCRRILRLLEHQWIQEQLGRFLRDPEFAEMEQLPGWRHFLDVLGGNRKTALTLYRQLARDRQTLLLNWNDPRQLQRTLEQLVQVVYLQTRTHVGGRPRPPSTSTIAGLFAASLHPKVQPSAELLHILQMLSYQGSFRSAALGGQHSSALRHLLSRWLKRYHREIDSNRLLSWAVSFQLPGALEPAVQVVKNGGPNGHMLAQAMLVVARFGKREHAPLLKQHMKNQKVVYQLRRRSNDVLRVEVRDVALAVTIHLHGQDPKRFGFAELQRNPQLVFQPTSLGFSSQEARERAFDRWKKFLESGKL